MTLILGHKLVSHNRVDYADGHLRTVAGRDDRGPGFQNNSFRVHGACFGVIVGLGSVPGGKFLVITKILIFYYFS